MPMIWTTFDQLHNGETFKLDPTKADAFRKVDQTRAAELIGWPLFIDGATRRMKRSATVLVMTDASGNRVNL
jgi:hypothetical protein